MKPQTGQPIPVGDKLLVDRDEYQKMVTYQHRVQLIGQIAFCTSLVMLFATVAALEGGCISPIFALVSGLAWAGGMAEGGEVGRL